MKNLICITCPIGCHLTASDNDGELKVTGASCARGVDYARNELTDPRRVITSTVRILNAEYNQIPVKTLLPVPKNDIFNIMEELSKITLTSPVFIGDIVIKNVCNTGIDIVATRSL